MDKLKKSRTVIRTSFTRIYNTINDALSIDNPDIAEIQSNLCLLNAKIEALSNIDHQILDMLLEIENISETELDAEVSTADEYTSRYNKIKIVIEQHLTKGVNQMTNKNDINSASDDIRKKLKLPTIEFKRFSGEIRDWLPFWSQFKRIHEDVAIENEDKFQYLLQSTLPKSRAHQLVASYPCTGDNYPKVIDSLKSRFGRDDLLVEVYVRELLKLVLSNLNKKIPLSTLYDKMESQLRALETLGVTSDKCAAMLYPLVESCLPEELLRVWQRSTVYDKEADLKTRLENMMTFLRNEVENEERISLALSGFDIKDKTYQRREIIHKEIPTAAGLVNNKIQTLKCVFCQAGHLSKDCEEAQRLCLSEKMRLLKKNGCCFSCTKYGHITKKCRMNMNCSRCQGKHVTIMCPNLQNKEEITSGSDKVTAATVCENTLTNHTYTEVLLQTVVVQMMGLRSEKPVRALIDTGSQKSYVTESVAAEMEYLPIREEKIIHSLFGGSQSDTCNHKCYRIRLGNVDNSYACNFEALDQPIICQNISSVPEGPWMAELQKLGIKITDNLAGGPIEVLIGADVVGKLYTGRRHVLSCGLVAMETLLGWTLFGKIPSKHKDKFLSTMIVTSMISKDATLEELWRLDTLGITDPSQKKSRQEIEQVTMEHFLNTVKINYDGRYEVRMPWIEGHPPVPSNFNMAKCRLDTLRNKLEKDGFYNEYSHVFHEWLEEDIIEEIPDCELQDQGHYLPHRHVVKINSTTTKIRPVFDASAKEKGSPSLNDCLEKGMNLIELVPSILTRFRLSKIGVVSDIRKAFLQIGLHKNDRNFLRFLWNEEGRIKVFRHKRVVFGIVCSPFLLGAVINYHLQRALNNNEGMTSRYSNNVIVKLMKSFYVDNCVTSVNNIDELNQFIKEATELMAEGRFDLRGWEHTIIENKEENTELTPVLGLSWDRVGDTLELCADCLKEVSLQQISKRTILSVAHKLFDPIGFTCPVSLCPKLLLQQTWSAKVNWDEEVPLEIKHKFIYWMKNLSQLSNLKIPRWLLQENEKNNGSLSLHCFCDASQSAYAAVIFLRSESINKITVQLVQAKSRVSPVKKVTIPRLEMLAATIGARLTNTVIENLDIIDIPVFFWTDSTTVLAWIKREDHWGTFIWNRVQEIRKLTNVESWHHVPGVMNPADLPSRGCTPKQLIESRWWEGPAWLKKSSREWPSQEYTYDYDEELINQERRKGVVSSLISTEKADDTWYYTYFSKYNKIVRMIAWIKRFIFNCRKSENSNREIELSVEELADAERCVIKLIQKESFNGIRDKRLQTLNPFEDSHGLIRIKSRILRRPDQEEFRYPLVLPQKHPVVERLIYEEHGKACHVGVQGLLSIMRERFWILSGRRVVRSVIAKCVTCRRFSAKSMETFPVPLPEDRVRDASVFEITGVDFAGPVFLRRNKKAWICLFTCAVYRAVHLELVTSLSTDAFLQTLRRFIARRGRPSVIYSDNATNFVGAEQAFGSLDWQNIAEYSTAQRISWKFNPPSAAWWGGWWERLIRLIKQLLRRVLGKSSLTYEELLTILCDCESIINSRPLTYLSEDSNDLVALTPGMFLSDIKEIGVPDIDTLEEVDLTRRWRYRKRLKENLRSRFRIEYLGQLTHQRKKGSSRRIKIGEIVLVGKHNLKRLDWPLGRVEELLQGQDGEVRLVRLKTSSGYLLRPIQRIYPLEVESAVIVEESSLDKEGKRTCDMFVSHVINGKSNEKRRERKIIIPCNYLSYDGKFS